MTQNENQTNRNEDVNPNGCLIAVIVLVFLIALCYWCIDSCFSPENSVQEDTSTSEKYDFSESDYTLQTDETTSIKVGDFIECPDFTAEKNSTEMIDQIASVAKANIENFADSDAEKVIEEIRKAGHKFYSGPEEMEKYMWYGYLLDYKYDDSDPRSELGTDLTQAIKYVYRDVETVLDDSTKSNLEQIDKDLTRIG